jgi:hypothetical protein
MKIEIRMAVFPECVDFHFYDNICIELAFYSNDKFYKNTIVVYTYDEDMIKRIVKRHKKYIKTFMCNFSKDRDYWKEKDFDKLVSECLGETK